MKFAYVTLIAALSAVTANAFETTPETEHYVINFQATGHSTTFDTSPGPKQAPSSGTKPEKRSDKSKWND